MIRGAIYENYAIKLFEKILNDIGLTGYQTHTLGFIVDGDYKGSAGFAPDLIAIGRTPHGILEFILIEIKGIKYLKRNTDYYRGLDLATKQIKSGSAILSAQLTPDQLIIQRGYVVLCCIEQDLFNMEIHQITL